MAGLIRRQPHGEASGVFSRFDRLFDEWLRMMPFRPMALPPWLEAGDLIRVEEYQQDGTLVIRVSWRTLPAFIVGGLAALAAAVAVLCRGPARAYSAVTGQIVRW